MMKGTCENLGEKIHSVRCSNCRNSLGFKVIILLMMMLMMVTAVTATNILMMTIVMVAGMMMTRCQI